MNIPEFIYTVVLRPKPLKILANAVIRRIIPSCLNSNGAVVVLNPNDPVVSGALTLGVYEKPETKFFSVVCRPGMTFLDIGANVGYYTALAIARIGKDGRIIALEPDQENFGFLQQTVAANGAQNTTCVQKAAAAENGSLTLYVSTSNRGDNRLYSNEFAGSTSQVEVCTIDALLAQMDIASVDLVKIDVQGFEGHVLRGMKETIRHSSNLILLMEFWPFGLRSAGTSPQELLIEMEQAGLKLLELTQRGNVVPLGDKNDIINRHPGRRYTNIVAYRGEAPPLDVTQQVG